jgi:hypothetical protein
MATSNDTRVRVEGFSKIRPACARQRPVGLDGAARQIGAGALHRPAGGDDAVQRSAIEIADVQEMPG